MLTPCKYYKGGIHVKLTVIGYWGAYPASQEATSGYFLEKDEYKLLIDCGSGVLSRMQPTIQVMDLDAVILSHYHFDHVADIGVLQYARKVNNMLQKTNEVLPIYGHDEDKQSFQNLNHEYTKGIAYHPNQPLNIGPFEIDFLKTNHPVPCYAMRITDGESSIIYTADSSYKEGFISFSQGADLLIADCNFYKGMDGSKPGHMNSVECAHIAKAAGVKELCLSHLPHFGNINQLAQEASEHFDGVIHLASEGLVWER